MLDASPSTPTVAGKTHAHEKNGYSHAKASALEMPVVVAHRASLASSKRIDIQRTLHPIQSGLQQVEEKMNAVESTLFAPLSQAFVDLIGSGGKRLRPALALMAAELEGPLEDPAVSRSVISIAAAIEMLHTSTLVHDDVIDGALLRRGSATLNAQWTQGSTVLAGNYMFGRAAYFAAETENMRVINGFSNTLNVMVDGELDQIAERFHYTQSKESYYRRIYAKTASLFCSATESAAILANMSSTQTSALYDFGYNLGVAFQIMDDILDFTSDEKSLGKPVGSDLAQGTLTLPFFYFLQEHAEPEELCRTIDNQREQAENDGRAVWTAIVQDLVAQVCASGAIELALEEVHSFLEQAEANLLSFPNTAYKQSMLDLCTFVVQRTY